jgi:hypothetical protein
LFLLTTPTTLEAHSLRPRRTIEIQLFRRYGILVEFFINQTLKPI